MIITTVVRTGEIQIMLNNTEGVHEIRYSLDGLYYDRQTPFKILVVEMGSNVMYSTDNFISFHVYWIPYTGLLHPLKYAIPLIPLYLFSLSSPLFSCSNWWVRYSVQIWDVPYTNYYYETNVTEPHVIVPNAIPGRPYYASVAPIFADGVGFRFGNKFTFTPS